MKLLILYKDCFYYNDKIINNISNQTIKVAYFETESLHNLQSLYKRNNLIIKLMKINEMNLKDGDYSLDIHSIQINNNRVVNIHDKLHHYNPIHRSINFKQTEINAYIIYHNILYYNKYVFILCGALFIISYYLFNMTTNIDMSNRSEIIKTFT